MLDRSAFQKKHGIIGNSVEMKELIETAMQVAPTDITVMLSGESGTGKEVIAHALHNASRRSHRRFVAVNCGAIPEGILESELFGHEKGSFTGATESRKGYFEIADGGTIFLDEIGDTPLATQVKLLRVLETGEFMKVGSSDQLTVDVRVITASNKELEDEVRAKRFRQDLYFRLRSVNIRIPPLRSRRGDIPALVEHFLAEAVSRNKTEPIMFADGAMSVLMNYPWPGNVRELRNTIESIAILEQGRMIDDETVQRYLHPVQDIITERPLPMWLGKTTEQAEREMIFRALYEIRTDLLALREVIERMSRQAPLSLPAPAEQAEQEGPISLDDSTLQDMERRMIARALERFEGNRRLAAGTLGISERTLYRKIKEYGL